MYQPNQEVFYQGRKAIIELILCVGQYDYLLKLCVGNDIYIPVSESEISLA